MEMSLATACGSVPIVLQTMLVVMVVMMVFAGPLLRRASSLMLVLVLPVLAGLLGAFNGLYMTARAVAVSGGGVHSTAAGSAESLMPLVVASFVVAVFATLALFRRGTAPLSFFATPASLCLGVAALIGSIFLFVSLASLNRTAWFEAKELVLPLGIGEVVIAVAFCASLALLYPARRLEVAPKVSSLLISLCAITAAASFAGLWSLQTVLRNIARGIG